MLTFILLPTTHASIHSSHLSPLSRPPPPALHPRRSTPRPSLIRLCAAPPDPSSSAPGGGASVENGVKLPPLAADAVDDERARLAQAVVEWLDREWVPQEVHGVIGRRAAEVYVRARMEGEDLGGIVLAVGTELEAMDFYEAFVGPFDVGNKVAELVLRSLGRETCCDGASDDEIRQFQEDHPIEAGSSATSSSGETKPPKLPALATGFDKHLFLQQVMDGRVPAQLVDSVVLLELGYSFSEETGRWEVTEVRDKFWKESFIDRPPRFVGPNADKSALDHLHLQILDDKGKQHGGLDEIIDSLYGEEIARISRQDGNEDFLQRELVCKFLSFVGGF